MSRDEYGQFVPVTVETPTREEIVKLANFVHPKGLEDVIEAAKRTLKGEDLLRLNKPGLRNDSYLLVFAYGRKQHPSEDMQSYRGLNSFNLLTKSGYDIAFGALTYDKVWNWWDNFKDINVACKELLSILEPFPEKSKQLAEKMAEQLRISTKEEVLGMF